jgi:hypothetical protein
MPVYSFPFHANLETVRNLNSFADYKCTAFNSREGQLGAIFPPDVVLSCTAFAIAEIERLQTELANERDTYANYGSEA